jgi:hypothetical protein
MSYLPLGKLLAEGDFGPFEKNLLGDYFEFVRKCRAVAQGLSRHPLYRWRKFSGNEVELLPEDGNGDGSEEWKARTLKILRVTGGRVNVYAVTKDDLEQRGQKEFVKHERRDDCELELVSCEPEEFTMEFVRLPPKDTLLYLDVDSQALDAQHRALDRLSKNPHPLHHRHLLGLFSERGLHEEFWDDVDIEPVDIDWKILKSQFPGAEAQMTFVRKALATPDLVLLKGPPGAGKTTAISEFILQVAARHPGARMLLTASTHVAIDNVLEKLADHAAKVTCVRIASGETAKNVKHPKVQEMLLKNIVQREKARISAKLAGTKSEAAKLFRSTIEGTSDDDLKELILTSATLAAGTPRGILQHPFLKRPTGNPALGLMSPVPFDYIILDEASKTSLLEFLVPAVHARRWVIVGDDCQLPPYMGRVDVASALRVCAERYEEKQLDEVAGNLVRWRERYFQKAERGEVEIPSELRDAADQVRRIFLPSIYGLLARGHRLSRGSVLAEGLPEEAFAARSVALDYQNRMHPQISEFPRNAFYSGSEGKKGPSTDGITLLKDNPGLKARKWPLAQEFTHRTVWMDVPVDGEEENPAEAYVVASEALRLAEKSPGISIAVICFYKKQRRLVERAYEELSKESLARVGHDVEFLTVDSCQGREADIVLVSFSLPGASMFMKDPNRLNVAITRARHQLILVGNHRRTAGKGKNSPERDDVRDLALHHQDKLVTIPDLLTRAKHWRPAKRADADSRASGHGSPSHGRSGGGPKEQWRKPEKPKAPDRFNNPFDGLDFPGGRR